MQISAADGIEQERVLNGIEGLRYVDGDSGCAKWWLWAIETSGNVRHGGKESSGSGVARAEAVLSGRDSERGREERKKQALQDFGGRAEEGDGTIGFGIKGWFSGFRYRED